MIKLEKRNEDITPLKQGGYKEGADYFVSGPHSNGSTKNERHFVEYHCMKCVWSNPYPERMKQHLDADLHLHRPLIGSRKAATLGIVGGEE